MFTRNKQSYFLCMIIFACVSFFVTNAAESTNLKPKTSKKVLKKKKPINLWPKLLRDVNKDATLQALIIEHIEKQGDPRQAKAVVTAKKKLSKTMRAHPLSVNAASRLIAENLFYAGKYERAIPIYRAMKLRALHDATNYAEALLGAGNYGEGFEAFDSRLDIPDARNNDVIRRNMLQNPWDGSNPKGKKILVHTEFGLGDTFLFARYLSALKNAGARVIVAARPAEKAILGSCLYIDKIVDTNPDVKAEHAEDVFLMSLPRYLSKKGLTPTSLETIPYGSPEDGPYIPSNAPLNTLWKTIVNSIAQQSTLLKIGIWWRASLMPGGQIRMLQRDVPLNALAQFSKIKEVQLFNLQGGGQHCPLTQQEFDSLSKEEREKLNVDEHDIIPDGCHVENVMKYDLKTAKPIPVPHDKPFVFDQEHGAFADTLALAHQMDLIVSVDSSLPSLTAAAGLKTIYLLPKESDWRWLNPSYKTSPWFPSAQLLWQHKQGDWTKPLEELRTIINHELQKKQQS